MLRHDDGLTAAQAGIDTNNIGEKKKRCRQSMWDTSMHVGYLARKHVMALTKYALEYLDAPLYVAEL